MEFLELEYKHAFVGSAYHLQVVADDFKAKVPNDLFDVEHCLEEKLTVLLGAY